MGKNARSIKMSQEIDDKFAQNAWIDASEYLIAKVKEAIEKFGDSFAEKIKNLFTSTKNRDEDNLKNAISVSALRQKYEKAVNLIDEALNSTENADKFWTLIEESLKETLESEAFLLDKTDGGAFSNMSFTRWGEDFIYK